MNHHKCLVLSALGVSAVTVAVAVPATDRPPSVQTDHGKRFTTRNIDHRDAKLTEN